MQETKKKKKTFNVINESGEMSTHSVEPSWFEDITEEFDTVENRRRLREQREKELRKKGS